jgi:hypothetical protein
MYLPATNTLAWSTNGAEGMRLDASGNLGIGTNSPLEKLHVNQGNIYTLRTGGAKLRLADQLNEVSFESVPVGSSSDAIWKTSSVERMRLDASGNLGIGTSSPGARLDVVTGTARWRITNDGSGNIVNEVLDSTGAAYRDYKLYGLNLISYTGGVERMRLDASGNLGLGVTPSAWGSGIKSVQVGNYSALTNSQGGYTWLSNNAFYDTAWKYLTTNRALYYAQDTGSGAHQWFNAPSDTAGNAISFTQAMTLDANGNLLVGTTNPELGAGFGNIQVQGSSGAIVQAQTGAGTVKCAISTDASNGYAGTRTNHPLIFTTNNTECARITSGGDLLVGTTTSNGKFTVAGVTGSANNTVAFSNGTDPQYLDVLCGRALTNGTAGGVASSLVMTLRSSGVSAGDMAFATGNNEVARITAGSSVLVGTTTLAGTGGLTLQSIADGYAIVNHNNAGATGYVFQSFRRSGTEIGSITQNGTTAVLFNTTSDRRLKDNIAPAPSASDIIDAIEIVSHDWKAAPDEHVTYGVIAQDLHAVAPQAVLQGDDGDEIEKTWGVDYSKLVPMLIKEIQSLRARVAALEA